MKCASPLRCLWLGRGETPRIPTLRWKWSVNAPSVPFVTIGQGGLDDSMAVQSHLDDEDAPSFMETVLSSYFYSMSHF